MKRQAVLSFRGILVDARELGSDAGHMVSRVFFDLDVGEEKYENVHADVKQPVGTDFRRATLEIGAPEGYPGILDDEAFRQGVDDFYRFTLRNLQIDTTAERAKFANCHLAPLPMTIEIELDPPELAE